MRSRPDDPTNGGSLLPPFFYTGPVNHNNAPEAGPIYLVGMMGAGKSTIGPALAERLERDFVDTDEAIEKKAGRLISEIFAEYGEAHFRRLERDAIEHASATDSVVALGGGALSQEGAAETLLARGIVVFLDASTSLILERIGDAASRPLLAGLCEEERVAKLDSLRAERSADYAKATFAVSADGQTETIVDQIMERLPFSARPSFSARLSLPATGARGATPSPEEIDSLKSPLKPNKRTQDG